MVQLLVLLILYTFDDFSSQIFSMGASDIYCSIRKLLWRRMIILIDADFTEIFEDVIISEFGVYCSVSKKLFR